MLSNGNFHIPALALAFDALRLALRHCATLCVARCQRMYSPSFSGLPLQLTSRGPEHSGFATIQKTLTALANEIRHLATRRRSTHAGVGSGRRPRADGRQRRRQDGRADSAAARPRRHRASDRGAGDRLAPVAVDALGRGTRAAYESCARASPCSTRTGRSVRTSRRSPRAIDDAAARATAGAHEVAPRQLGPGADRAVRARRSSPRRRSAIAFAISLVVGILAARSDRIFRWSIALSGFLYTIPTLAFLALLIPSSASAAPTRSSAWSPFR
jgi:hypothetical protein